MIAATHNTNALSNSTSIDKYIMRKEQVKHHLMNNTLLSTLTLSLPQNIKYIQYYQELFNCLIPIHTFKPKKLEEPDIPLIQIEKTDTNEIKKMIRKLNIETQSFACNHLAFDHKYDSFEADIGRVYLMQEKKDVDELIDYFVHIIMNIEDKDRRNKDAYTLSQQISLSDIKKINEKIIAINNKLIEIESFFKSLKCHKCEHILKKYLITKETIEEMRQELKEERELAESLKHVVVSELREDLQEVNVKFIECVRYIPSIDMYCAADIMNSEGKAISEWLKNSSSQNVRRNHPDMFSFINLGRGKKSMFVKYEMIPILLSWIDPSLGVDFMLGTQKSKLRRYGYIYLVQYPEDIKKHIVKVGRTFNIRKRYQNKVDVIAIEYVDDMFDEEKKLIETFAKKYGDPVRGNEYFRCFKIEDAIKTFYDVVYETHND